MKIDMHIKRLISDRLDPIMIGAVNLRNLAAKKSRKIFEMKELKNFKLTVAQIRMIEKKLLQGSCLDICSVRNAAQDKAQTKAWNECVMRDRLSATICSTIRERTSKLRTNVLADLELCDSGDEQRVIVSLFQKHDLSKPWKIKKTGPKVPAPEAY